MLDQATYTRRGEYLEAGTAVWGWVKEVVLEAGTAAKCYMGTGRGGGVGDW